VKELELNADPEAKVWEMKGNRCGREIQEADGYAPRGETLGEDCSCLIARGIDSSTYRHPGEPRIVVQGRRRGPEGIENTGFRRSPWPEKPLAVRHGQAKGRPE